MRVWRAAGIIKSSERAKIWALSYNSVLHSTLPSSEPYNISSLSKLPRAGFHIGSKE